jgi:hypothetical protein
MDAVVDDPVVGEGAPAGRESNTVSQFSKEKLLDDMVNDGGKRK